MIKNSIALIFIIFFISYWIITEINTFQYANNRFWQVYGTYLCRNINRISKESGIEINNTEELYSCSLFPYEFADNNEKIAFINDIYKIRIENDEVFVDVTDKAIKQKFKNVLLKNDAKKKTILRMEFSSQDREEIASIINKYRFEIMKCFAKKIQNR